MLYYPAILAKKSCYLASTFKNYELKRWDVINNDKKNNKLSNFIDDDNSSPS